MPRDQLLQDPAPLFDRFGNVVSAVAPTSKDGNRFANNDLVAAMTRSGDEEWIDWHLCNLGENEGAVGQADLSVENPRGYLRQFFLHAIRYITARWTRPSAVWLRAEIEMARNWGRVCEFRSRLP